MIKNTCSIQWKIPGQTLFFRARAKCSKILNNKKYIFSTVNSGHPLFFRTSASCSKISNVKSISNTVKIVRTTLFFRASASCSKILNDKIYFNTMKNCRATLFSGQVQVAQKSWKIKNTYSVQWKIPGKILFFRASASCSKILIVKSILHTVKNSRANSVFQGKSKLLKYPEL